DVSAVEGGAMAADNRPLSPHLQVYRPQWTSVLSILHRATGVVTAIGLVYVAWWLIAAASGGDYYESFAWFAGSIFGNLLFMGFTFCLFYHLCNGIRHLVWDTGRNLELEGAYKSGLMVVAGAGVLTLIAWIAALAA
ncbi:MAG: succinate dehydrogenase, cytochrome b556 subunit, partial [Alphaproteobacteria bacterium]